MTIYGAVSSAAINIKSYQGVQAAAGENSNLALDAQTDSPELKRQQQSIVNSIRNLDYANTLMGIIYKNIKDLQP